MGVELIICPNCLEAKEESSFYNRHTVCRSCNIILKRRAYQNDYAKTDKRKASQKLYREKPEVAERLSSYFHDYGQRPEIKEHRKNYMREYRHAKKEQEDLTAFVLGIIE